LAFFIGIPLITPSPFLVHYLHFDCMKNVLDDRFCSGLLKQYEIPNQSSWSQAPGDDSVPMDILSKQQQRTKERSIENCHSHVMPTADKLAGIL